MSASLHDGESARLRYRASAEDDLPELALLNRRLIVDEGHANTMSVETLEARLRQWLAAGEYEATLVLDGGACVGYALWQRQEFCVYVRHFLIIPERRREGLGREAMTWMQEHLWGDTPRVRLDVLVDNTRGLQFWRALGFSEYCLTMQLELPRPNNASNL